MNPGGHLGKKGSVCWEKVIKGQISTLFFIQLSKH